MIVTERINFQTEGDCHVLDITEQISRKLLDSGLQSGTITLFTPSSTSGLTTIEYESGAVQDLQRLFDRLVPTDLDYRHNLRWHDGNGHSHVRHALLGASLSVPFVRGQMTLGTWQQIVFVDFDNRARSRSLVVQIMGE